MKNVIKITMIFALIIPAVPVHAMSFFGKVAQRMKSSASRVQARKTAMNSRRKNPVTIQKRAYERCPYDILGLPNSATKEEVKNAHRELAKMYHPDHKPEHEKKDAEEMCKKINSAYDAITKENNSNTNNSNGSIYEAYVYASWGSGWPFNVPDDQQFKWTYNQNTFGHGYWQFGNFYHDPFMSSGNKETDKLIKEEYARLDELLNLYKAWEASYEKAPESQETWEAFCRYSDRWKKVHEARILEGKSRDFRNLEDRAWKYECTLHEQLKEQQRNMRNNASEIRPWKRHAWKTYIITGCAIVGIILHRKKARKRKLEEEKAPLYYLSK